MHNDEKTLKNCSKAYKMVGQLKNLATSCFESNPQKKEEAITFLDDLQAIFKPYHDEMQKIQEGRKQHELNLKTICAEQGHTGEWKEETYYHEGWMGDLSDRQWVKQPRVRWVRTCTRCGKPEVSEIEPEEVKQLRKRKEIESLEEQLKKMKAEL